GNVGPIDKGAAQAATRQGVFAWLRPPSAALFTCVRGEPSAGLETCDTAGLEACATGAVSKCNRTFPTFAFLFELFQGTAACWPHEPHPPHWCLYCWCGPGLGWVYDYSSSFLQGNRRAAALQS